MASTVRYGHLWTSVDWVVISVLVSAAVHTRITSDPPGLSFPSEIVWDETHFTKFATWYASGHYFVDIHPPLAKLVHAMVLKATGFRGAEEKNPEWWTDRGFIGTRDHLMLYDDDHIDGRGGSAPFLAMRAASAMAGVGFVAATYLAGRRAGLAWEGSTVAAVLVLFDNLICLQSRLILTDAFLYLFVALAIACSFSATRVAANTALPPIVAIATFVATGATLGCALAVKLTALGTFGFVGLHQAFHTVPGVLGRLRRRVEGGAARGGTAGSKRGETGTKKVSKRGKGGARANNGQKILSEGSGELIDFVWRLLLIIGACVGVWVGFWVIHIYVLPWNGQGTAFMGHAFQRTLVPKPFDAPLSARYRKAFSSMSLTNKIVQVVQTTWNINQGGGALLEHPAKSRFYQWPLHSCKVIDFWRQGKRQIRGAANVAAWWLVAVAVAFATVRMAVRGVVTRTSLTGKTATATTTIKSAQKSQQGRAAPQGVTQADKTDTPAVASDAGQGGAEDTEKVVGLLLVGYFANLLPFMLVERATWNYHYVPAYIFGVLIVGCFVHECSLRIPTRGIKRWLFWAVLAAGVAVVAKVFFVLSPWTYGLPLSPNGHRQLALLSSAAVNPTRAVQALVNGFS